MRKRFVQAVAAGAMASLLLAGGASVAQAAGPSIDAVTWSSAAGADARLVSGSIVVTATTTGATGMDASVYQVKSETHFCGAGLANSAKVGSTVAAKAGSKAGQWVATLDIRSLANSAPESFTYCFELVAKAGTSKSTPERRLFDVDNTVPTTALTGVSNGQWLYKAAAVTFTAKDTNLSSMQLAVGSTVRNATAAELATGIMKGTVPAPTKDAALVVKATAKDAAGNTTVKTATVQQIYNAPTAAVTTAKSPVNKSYTFAGTSARATKVTVAVMRGTKTLIGAKAVTLASNGTWKYALNTKLVTDGTITLKVVASNPVKTGVATAKSVVVDNTAPKVVAGKVSQAKGKFTLRASWSDANPNKIVAKMYNGSKLVWSGKVLTGKGAKSWAGTWPKTTVKGKTYTVKYTANDKLGQATTKAVKVKRTV